MNLTRALVALLIASTGITAALATDEPESALPDTFEFGTQQPGDVATYHFQRFINDEPSDVLVALHFELGAQELTMNARGEAQPVHVMSLQRGAYVDAETGWTQYNPGDDITPMPWRLRIADRYALTENETVWGGTFDGGVENVEGSYQGLVPTHTRSEFAVDGRMYTRGGYLLTSCLITPLPATVSTASQVDADRWCILSTPALDERHPSWSTGNALSSRTATGGWAGPWQFTARDLVETSFGPGILFDAKSMHAEVVFATGIPYPVQVRVELPDGGGYDVISLTHFERRDLAPERAVPPAVPDLQWTAPKPWGPDDRGAALPFAPSEAWQIALEAEPSNLANFLRTHPSAFVEAASLSRALVQTAGGIEERPMWSFQVRGGSAQVAFTVVAGETDATLALLPTADQPTVEYRSPVAETITLPAAPEQAPTLASVLRQYEALTGRSATSIGWSPGCNGWVQAFCEDDEPGWSLEARDSTYDNSQEVDPESATLQANGRLDAASITWYPDGQFRSITESAFDSQEQFGGQPASRSEEQPAIATVAAPDVRVVSLRAAAIGGGAILAAILVYFWPALKTSGLGLFSRIQPEATLDHPVRAKLAAEIASSPGIHFQALSRAAGSGHGATEHHLRKLTEAGHVVKREAAGYTCYFPKHTDRRVMDAAPNLRSDTARALLATIHGNGGLTGGELARGVDVNRATVSHHVKRLAEVGVVRSERDGRAIRYWITPLGEDVLRSGVAA